VNEWALKVFSRDIRFGMPPHQFPLSKPGSKYDMIEKPCKTDKILKAHPIHSHRDIRSWVDTNIICAAKK
jgi:hypothetical protein